MDRIDAKFEEIKGLLKDIIRKKFGREYEEILAEQEAAGRFPLEDDTVVVEEITDSDPEMTTVPEENSMIEIDSSSLKLQEIRSEEKEATKAIVEIESTETNIMDSCVEEVQGIQSEAKARGKDNKVFTREQSSEEEIYPRYSPNSFLNMEIVLRGKLSVELQYDYVGDRQLCPVFPARQVFDEMLSLKCDQTSYWYDISATARFPFEPGLCWLDSGDAIKIPFTERLDLPCTSSDSPIHDTSTRSETNSRVLEVVIVSTFHETLGLHFYKTETLLTGVWYVQLNTKDATDFGYLQRSQSVEEGTVILHVVMNHLGEWWQNKVRPWYRLRVSKLVGESGDYFASMRVSGVSSLNYAHHANSSGIRDKAMQVSYVFSSLLKVYSARNFIFCTSSRFSMPLSLINGRFGRVGIIVSYVLGYCFTNVMRIWAMKSVTVSFDPGIGCILTSISNESLELCILYFISSWFGCECKGVDSKDSAHLYIKLTAKILMNQSEKLGASSGNQATSWCYLENNLMGIFDYCSSYSVALRYIFSHKQYSFSYDPGRGFYMGRILSLPVLCMSALGPCILTVIFYVGCVPQHDSFTKNTQTRVFEDASAEWYMTDIQCSAINSMERYINAVQLQYGATVLQSSFASTFLTIFTLFLGGEVPWMVVRAPPIFTGVSNRIYKTGSKISNGHIEADHVFYTASEKGLDTELQCSEASQRILVGCIISFIKVTMIQSMMGYLTVHILRILTQSGCSVFIIVPNSAPPHTSTARMYIFAGLEQVLQSWSRVDQRQYCHKITFEQHSPILGIWGTGAHNLQIFFSLLETIVVNIRAGICHTVQKATATGLQHDYVTSSSEAHLAKKVVRSTIYSDHGYGTCLGVTIVFQGFISPKFLHSTKIWRYKSVVWPRDHNGSCKSVLVYLFSMDSGFDTQSASISYSATLEYGGKLKFDVARCCVTELLATVLIVGGAAATICNVACAPAMRFGLLVTTWILTCCYSMIPECQMFMWQGIIVLRGWNYERNADSKIPAAAITVLTRLYVLLQRGYKSQVYNAAGDGFQISQNIRTSSPVIASPCASSRCCYLSITKRILTGYSLIMGVFYFQCHWPRAPEQYSCQKCLLINDCSMFLGQEITVWEGRTYEKNNTRTLSVSSQTSMVVQTCLYDLLKWGTGTLDLLTQWLASIMMETLAVMYLSLVSEREAVAESDRVQNAHSAPQIGHWGSQSQLGKRSIPLLIIPWILLLSLCSLLDVELSSRVVVTVGIVWFTWYLTVCILAWDFAWTSSSRTRMF